MVFENKHYPSTEELLEVFFYEEDEGIICDIISEEDVSHYDSETDENFITFRDQNFLVADIAWLMMGRKIPEGSHIRSMNLSGYPKYSKNNLAPELMISPEKVEIPVSGSRNGKGYYFDKVKGKWKVQVSVGKGKRISGGYFSEEDEAEKTANHIRSSYVKEGCFIKSQQMKRKLPKHIYSSGSKYKVLLTVNEKLTYIGTYNSLSNAVIARDEALGVMK